MACDHEYCLVLEDDFILCDDFDKELSICLNELPSDFKGLWLGGRVIGRKQDYSLNLWQINATTGTYGYLINMNYVNDFLAALSPKNKPCDWLMSAAFKRVFRSKKDLVLHRKGYSEIKGKLVNY